MPTDTRADGKPQVSFDPSVEISPFVVFRRLREGRALLLVDVREAPGHRSLSGSIALGAGFQPPPDADVVLFDDHGDEAIGLARQLHEAGHPRVRALFGGLDLYEFSLDPQVVGEETFLEDAAD